jgi:hypothetical protein
VFSLTPLNSGLYANEYEFDDCILGSLGNFSIIIMRDSLFADTSAGTFCSHRRQCSVGTLVSLNDSGSGVPGSYVGSVARLSHSSQKDHVTIRSSRIVAGGRIHICGRYSQNLVDDLRDDSGWFISDYSSHA